MMDETTYNLLEPDVQAAARTTAREWPDFIPVEDAEQEVWLLLLEGGQRTVDELCGMDRAQRVSALTTFGHRIAARYRDDYELFSGNFVYGTKHVRTMLDSDVLFLEDGQPDSLTNTERMDLDSGIASLRKKNAGHVDVLVHQYAVGKPVHSHPMELKRAVDALTLEMNRAHRNGRVEP